MADNIPHGVKRKTLKLQKMTETDGDTCAGIVPTIAGDVTLMYWSDFMRIAHPNFGTVRMNLPTCLLNEAGGFVGVCAPREESQETGGAGGGGGGAGTSTTVGKGNKGGGDKFASCIMPAQSFLEVFFFENEKERDKLIKHVRETGARICKNWNQAYGGNRMVGKRDPMNHERCDVLSTFGNDTQTTRAELRLQITSYLYTMKNMYNATATIHPKDLVISLSIWASFKGSKMSPKRKCQFQCQYSAFIQLLKSAEFKSFGDEVCKMWNSDKSASGIIKKKKLTYELEEEKYDEEAEEEEYQFGDAAPQSQALGKEEEEEEEEEKQE